MVSKVPSGSLSAVESTMNQSHFPDVFESKLNTTDDIILLRTWCLQISVTNIGSKNIETVQSSISKGNTYALP
jgi:hypothetical protein